MPSQNWILIFLLLTAPSALGQGQVAVLPIGQAVAGIRGTVVFTCTISGAVITTTEWLLNGTSLSSLQLRGVTQEFVRTLWFQNVPAEYNHTRIQCVANGVLSTENSMLLVQGLLSAVDSLNVTSKSGSLILSWIAPFTFDITISVVDITYCVDVASPTSSATLQSECGINVTEFTFTLPSRSWCHEYNFTVTPVNVAGNGTKRSTQYYQPFRTGSQLEEVISGYNTISLLLSAPVCHAELILIDNDTGEITFLEETDLAIAETNITINVQQIKLNRKYRAFLSTSNLVGHVIHRDLMISTHDLAGCTVSQQESNEVVVSISFKPQSRATRAFISFIFINENGAVNFEKSSSQIIERNNASYNLNISIHLQHQGHYVAYAYDIGSNGRIMNGIGYQASSCEFEIINSQGSTLPPPHYHNCSVTSHGRTIAVTFASSFQALAQLNALDNVNILHVNTSMDPQTPVTLQVTENGEYLVTILPVQDGRGILSGVAFSQTHVVTDAPAMATIEPTISQMPKTPSAASMNYLSKLTIGLGVGMGTLTFVCAVLGVWLVIQQFQMKSMRYKMSELPTHLTAKSHHEKAGVQIYEEIGERVAGQNALATSTPVYEDVPNINNYQITACSAYGVH